MPKFDYKGAKDAGYSDQQIEKFIAQQNAHGADLWIDGAEYDSAQTPAPLPGGFQPAATEATQTDPLAPLRPPGDAFNKAVSPLLFVMDRLAQAGSQAAGGAYREYTRPGPDTPGEALGALGRAAGAYGQGLYSGLSGQQLQPELIDELKKAGWESAISPEAAALMNEVPGMVGVNVPAGSALRAITSPEAAAIAGSTAATLPFDVIGGALLKGGSALSQVPKVAEALDVGRAATSRIGNALSRGYSMPGKFREPIRDIFMGARGERKVLESEFNDLLDEASQAIDRSAAARGVDPALQEKRVRDIMEMGHIDPRLVNSANPDELQAVMALSRMRAILPFIRGGASLKEMSLGSHIAKSAEEATAAATEQLATRQFARRLGRAEVPAPSYLPSERSGLETKVFRHDVEGKVPETQVLIDKLRPVEKRAAVGIPPLERVTPGNALESGLMGTPVSSGPRVTEYANEVARASEADVRRAESVAAQREKQATRAMRRFEARSRIGLPRLVTSKKIDVPESIMLMKQHETMFPKFTPRYLEGEAGAKAIEVSRLGTKVPGVRSLDRTLSTSQIEQITGKPMMPLLRAFETAGASTAKASANAKALSEVAARFGQSAAKAPKNWRNMSDLGVMSGLSKEARAAIGKTPFVHPEVFKYLDEFTTTIERDGNLLSDFLKGWKPAVTSINPQFISRNGQWNAIIGWIRGNRDPRNWTDAAAVLGRGNPLTEIRGLKLNADQLRNEMLRGNVIGTGTSSEALISGSRSAGRTFGEKLGKAATTPLRGMQGLNTAVEDLSRASFYIAMRRKGMSAMDAAKEVARTYFDYSIDANSPLINRLRAGAVPFVVWSRNILPLTFRSLVENPSSFTAIGALGRETAKLQGLSPENRTRLGPGHKENIAVTLPREFGDKTGTFRSSELSQVGFFDTERAIADPKKYVMSQLTPLITVPAEAAGIIKNAFTGKSSDDIVELPPVAAAFAKANPEAAKKIGVELAAEGRATGPQWLNTVLRTGGPMGSTVFDIFSSDPDRRLKVARWLTGVGIKRNLDPNLGRKFEQIAEKKKASEEKKHVKQARRLQQRIRREEANP